MKIYFLLISTAFGSNFLEVRYAKILFINIYDALIPKANINLSIATIGISDVHTVAGNANTHIQTAPPTLCAVKVAPKARATRNLFLSGHAKSGISQNRE